MGMKAYSEDLRERVVAAVKRGTRRGEVVEAFAVSRATVKRWVKQQRETGTLAAKPIPGPPAIKRDALLAALPERLVASADATLEEHCSWWQERTGDDVSTATMSRAITALAWTRKKRP
jgi:transposase